MASVQLILPPDYIHKASTAVRSAKHRVYLLSMVIADHPHTHELISELEAAAKRGVKVVVMADVFTFGEVSGGFLPIRYYSKGMRDTNRMVRVLKQSGVTFKWLGRGRITLFSGRTHSKWCVVDDQVFTFGGINIYQEGVANVDYMFHTTDAKLADRLVEEQKRIQRAEQATSNFSSVTYEYNDAVVLFDGGIVGQSVIYRRACELAEQAKTVTFVSQYSPTGKLARILKKRHSALYFNRTQQAEGLNRFVISLSQLVSGLVTLYTKSAYLHAKFIIFTMEDGTKHAITGSHNFAYTGVLLGTREVALETKDPNVIAQLEKFLEQEVVS